MNASDRSLARAILAVSSLVAVTGCASMAPVPLKPENAIKLDGTHCYLVVAQDEITAGIQRSNVAAATGGGLIPALIDVAIEKHRASAAEATAAPITREVRDFNFRERYSDELKKALPGIGTCKVSGAEVATKDLSVDERNALQARIADNGLLRVSTAYELSYDFRYISVITSASLWLRGGSDPIYRARFHYYSAPVTASLDRDVAVAAWAADHGKAVRTALAEGISETARMLALDVEGKSKFMSVPPAIFSGPLPAAATTSGLDVLSVGEHRHVFRYGGVVYSGADPTFTVGNAIPESAHK